MNSLGDSPVTYGFGTGIPLNIWIIYSKDPNFKWISLLYAFAWGVLNFALKFSRSYLDGASLKTWYFDLIVCAATLECNASDAGHEDTPSQYTDRKPTCFVIHWCGTSHWNPQPPIFMSCVLQRNPSTHCLYWLYIVEYTVSRYVTNPLMFIIVYRHNN